MKILFGIIAFHLLVIVSARVFKEKGALQYTIVIVLTLFLVAWVLFGMYTMEMPDTPDRF